MTVSLFESEQSEFLALRNVAGQYSLWPSWLEVPAGWSAEFGPSSRGDVLSYIENSWVERQF
ncbi:MbtH family protein [Arthrobacter sp. UM1]|uniref:MbtH family NRPS accessory protein n=1 Tax=Arthrobacter sp. UM1 TaxID=2766776 RepID=UPI001CF66D86|nr:MbtH family protein [Arthrobacter sp. UM1]